MFAYIIRRLLLMIPTLLGIMLLNFAIIQTAPGGPIEQMIARLEGRDVSALARITGEGAEVSTSQGSQSAGSSGEVSTYRGRRGLDQRHVDEIRKMFGFDKPAYVRFLLMIRSYATFDFGESFFKGRPVTELVLERMPVSISLGLWTTLIGYLISIPLGVAKAVRDGTRFDSWTTASMIAGSAIPGFLLAVFLIVMFAGGSYFQWFPLRGLVSDDWSNMSWPDRIIDYFWHMTLPLTALLVGSFTAATLLVKNSFLDQLGLLYVSTARAKGLTERQVLYRHVFRNALLIPIAGFPGAIIGIFFGGALLIETIFSLDGLGLLGYEAARARDYPIMFATLYFFSLLGLMIRLISDITYTIVDPRIDFEKRET
ncbi:MAG: microcin C ABC transporter permease YejB [Dongiaceae bacterium]